MSAETAAVAIRAALETALAAMTPDLPTAYENVTFVPPNPGVGESVAPAYQKANLLFARPDNSEYGRAFQEQGIFQVSLFYPLQIGNGDIATRAGKIRTAFPRGASFVHSGVVVTITDTPEIGAGTPDGDRYFMPVKIRFSSFIS